MIHSLSRRKSLELNFRGIQFKKFSFLFFFPLKGPVSAFICLFFPLISLIRFTGKRGDSGCFLVRFFCFLFPPYIWEVTVEQGLLTGEIPRNLGKGGIRKPAALQRKKNIDGLELSQYFQITRGVGRIERQLLPRHLLQQRRLLEI